MITSLAWAGFQGDQVIVAGTGAGSLLSADRGLTWSTHIDGAAIPPITSIAVASDDEVIIGTVNGCYRATLTGKVRDVMLAEERIFSIAAIPGAQATPQSGSATSAIIFAGTENDGILRSTESRETWEATNAGLLDLTILALAFSPAFARDRTGFAATASGLYRSRNGGRAWRQLDLAVPEMAVQSIAISPLFETDGVVLAGMEEEGLYASSDRGTHWAPVSSLPASSVNAIAISDDGKWIAAGTDRGVAVSGDGMLTWNQDGLSLGPVLALCFVPTVYGGRLLAGITGKGIVASGDMGASWIFSDPSS